MSGFNHAMIDLETYSTKANAVIACVGVVVFNRKEGIISCSSLPMVHIDDAGVLEEHLHVDAKTMDWWKTLPVSAHYQYGFRVVGSEEKSTMSSSSYLFKVIAQMSSQLRRLRDMFIDHNVKWVWGNGASFDLTILRETHTVLGEKAPWSYKDERCWRTMKDIMFKHDELEFEGTPHIAVDDARHQVKRLLASPWGRDFSMND